MSPIRNRMLALLAASAGALVLQACSGGGSDSAPKGPDVTAFTPATGTVSTVVTIQGARFGGTVDAPPTVTFKPSSGGAGVAALVKAVSDTSLDVVVPAVPAELAAAGTQFDVEVSNPGGGSTTHAKAFTMAAPVLADVNGGLAGSGSANAPFIVDGDAFGDLGAETAGFSVDFRDAATEAVVATAAVSYATGDWTNIYVVGTVPASLAAGTTYHVTVTTPSGTTAPRAFQVVGGVPFSPSQIQWSATSKLPVAQSGFSALTVPVGTTTYLYALGGNVATASATDGKASNVSTVYVNALAPDTGALANAAWTATTPLPAARGFAAAIAATEQNSIVAGNGALYVLGGLDATGAATDTVYFAKLSADGTVPAAGTPGTWTTTTALPQPLFGASAVLFHGRVYVAGGNDATGTPVAKVYVAKLQGDGTLAAWQELPDLPVAVAYHQLVTAAGYLYVLGGDSAAADPLTNAQDASAQAGVYVDQINIRDGALVTPTWAANAANLGKAREKFTAVVAGSYVLVSGGLYNGAATGSSEQAYAQFGTAGALGSFNGATGSHTIGGSTAGYPFYDHAAAFFVDAAGAPHVLVVGGADVATGNPVDGVWFQH